LAKGKITDFQKSPFYHIGSQVLLKILFPAVNHPFKFGKLHSLMSNLVWQQSLVMFQVWICADAMIYEHCCEWGTFSVT